MFRPDSVRPEDRILLLGIPDRSVIASLAARLTKGLLVVMGSDERVREGRRAAAAFDNVMFVVFSEGDLPWQDRFFSVVEDVAGNWPDPVRIERELRRVSAKSIL